jgi:KaiC/GvpD/RAD55 family RecA-like ATPase
MKTFKEYITESDLWDFNKVIIVDYKELDEDIIEELKDALYEMAGQIDEEEGFMDDLDLKWKDDTARIPFQLYDESWEKSIINTIKKLDGVKKVQIISEDLKSKTWQKEKTWKRR